MRVGIMLRLGSPDLSLKSLEAFGMESGFGDEWLRFLSLKIMGDGSGAGGTACVYEPQNRGPCGYGLWATEPEELNKFVLRAQKSRIRVSIHAIGDKGIDAALDAIENAQKEHPLQDMRHRIEHNSLCTPKQLERIYHHGVTPSSSIGYMYQLGDQYAKNFGFERNRWLHPHNTMNKMGIIAGGNSDAPVAYYNPFIQMYSAVTRKSSSGLVIGPEEAISIEDAIKIAAGTRGGPAGDAYLNVRVEPHPLFRREGTALLVEVRVGVVPRFSGEPSRARPSTAGPR